jgi:hypothetical protein
MATIYVKNGTPTEGQSKCASCVHVHMVRGYRESEEIVLCTYNWGHPLNVPFKVYECSNHHDKNRPTWRQMEDLAINVMPTSSMKHAGFRIEIDEEEDEEEELEAATANR